VLSSCSPLICSPDYPHKPFGAWYLTLFDLARVSCVVACMVLIGLIVTAWHRSYEHGGQRDRYLALAVFAFMVVGTEVENLGNIASYRLVLALGAVVLAIRGLLRFRAELPSKPGVNTPS
jgi:hypothetical protein